MVDQVQTSSGQVRAGTIKAYAIAAPTRASSAPDVPTVDEAGAPGLHMSLWYGFWAPPGTPAPLARRISDDLRTVLSEPAFEKRYEELGTYIRVTTPEQLTAFIREQQQIWRPVIAETAKAIKQ